MKDVSFAAIVTVLTHNSIDMHGMHGAWECPSTIGSSHCAKHNTQATMHCFVAYCRSYSSMCIPRHQDDVLAWSFPAGAWVAARGSHHPPQVAASY